MKESTKVAVSIALGIIMMSPAIVNFIRPLLHSTIPKGPIYEYPLTEEQRIGILREGKMVMTFIHKGQSEMKYFLEDLVNDNPDSLFLEEIKGSEESLYILGFNVTEDGVGLKGVFLSGKNFTEENVMYYVCELSFNPPLECLGM